MALENNGKYTIKMELFMGQPLGQLMYKCGKLYVIMMGSLNIHMRYKCTQVLNYD
jgi:hypothetical protein